MSIAIESAELMELYQWENLTTNLVIKNTELFESTKNELADILIYILSFANILELDLFKIINDKIDNNEKRFPVTNE